MLQISEDAYILVKSAKSSSRLQCWPVF